MPDIKSSSLPVFQIKLLHASLRSHPIRIAKDLMPCLWRCSWQKVDQRCIKIIKDPFVSTSLYLPEKGSRSDSPPSVCRDRLQAIVPDPVLWRGPTERLLWFQLLSCSCSTSISLAICDFTSSSSTPQDSATAPGLRGDENRKKPMGSAAPHVAFWAAHWAVQALTRLPSIFDTATYSKIQQPTFNI